MLKLSKAKYLWTRIERNINIPQGKNYIAFLILNGATRSRKWCELKFLSLSEKTETQKRTAESQKTLNRNILQLPISYALPTKKGSWDIFLKATTSSCRCLCYCRMVQQRSPINFPVGECVTASVRRQNEPG